MWLCNKCNGLQKSNSSKTPINRFLRLMETTNIGDIKEWCIDNIRALKILNKGRENNTWKTKWEEENQKL